MFETNEQVANYILYKLEMQKGLKNCNELEWKFWNAAVLASWSS